MPAIWIILGITKEAWSRATPEQKRKARQLANKGFKGLAKAALKAKKKATGKGKKR